MRDERISRLSKRFSTHAGGKPLNAERTRERHSLYLDSELVARLDKTYRDLNHQLYPRRVSKSTFLEALLEFGLERLDEIKAVLSVDTEDSEDS